MSTPDPTAAAAAFDAGVVAEVAVDAGPSAEEQADVKAWAERISQAREFDKEARKRYAVDRRYVRGDRGQFEVGLPIAGTYVDILKSFLYATDPDVDCPPSDATNPPPTADILKKAREQVESDPAALAAAAQAGTQAGSQLVEQVKAQGIIAATSAQEGAPALPALPGGQLPPDPNMVAKDAAQQEMQRLVTDRADSMMAPYRQRQAEAKQLGQTLETVIAHVWKQAKLKKAAEPVVASGLSVAIGWLKATWQERTGQDPVTLKKIADLQDNLARLDADQRELAAGDAPDPDALRASIKQQIAGLQAEVEVVVARGMAIDFISAEDIQVAPGVASLANYVDAPWIAHRTFMSMDDAKAAFPNLVDRDTDSIKNASVYTQVKPRNSTCDDVLNADTVDAKDADSYRMGTTSEVPGNVCVWEVWNKASNTVLTFLEGVKRYARAPYSPNPGTSRFYPFFQYAPVQVDGERHPQSMVQRTQTLLDDMNRIYSNRAEHRRRCIPKMGFDATNYEPEEVKKLEAGGIGEMVGIKPARPGDPVGNALQPIAYPMIDAALYDDAPTRAMLEMAWGIQEALSSTIRTPKTATEAEIQQTGTQARTSYMRDCLDTMLSDLAEYTAEIALQKLTFDDVKRIAGPWAFWPEGIGIEDLSTLVLVSIRAGSSGKPDTTRRREAWAAAMPTVQNAIVQVGQLRGSPPEAIADCIEELVAETLQRMGDKLDPARFLPAAPDGRAEVAGLSPQIQPPAAEGAAPPMGAPMPQAPTGGMMQ